MSFYLIDTDWIIDFLKGEREVVDRLLLLREAGLAVSIISLAELYEGIYSSKNADKHRNGLTDFLSKVEVLGIDEEVCKIFGKERATLRKQGKLIDNFDLLIAAICMRYGRVLITDNLKHFCKISGLKIADFCKKL